MNDIPDLAHFAKAALVLAGVASAFFGMRAIIRARRALRQYQYEEAERSRHEKWARPVIWDVRVVGNVCTFLALPHSHWRQRPWTAEAVMDALGKYQHNDRARIDAALGFSGVRPRVANEYIADPTSLNQNKEDVQEWFFPLPECFDSGRRFGEWFYIRGTPNWDVKVPLRKDAVKLPPEQEEY